MKAYYGKIDELILPAIEILNEKGYTTSACCSGHPDTGHDTEVAYIQFEFGSITPEELPGGWSWAEDGLMEHAYKRGNQEEIESTMADLAVWAKQLPVV